MNLNLRKINKWWYNHGCKVLVHLLTIFFSPPIEASLLLSLDWISLTLIVPDSRVSHPIPPIPSIRFVSRVSPLPDPSSISSIPTFPFHNSSCFGEWLDCPPHLRWVFQSQFYLNSISSLVCLSCANTELCVLLVVSVDFMLNSRENVGNEVLFVSDLLPICLF
jgi:hypothetical protein